MAKVNILEGRDVVHYGVSNVSLLPTVDDTVQWWMKKVEGHWEKIKFFQSSARAIDSKTNRTNVKRQMTNSKHEI